MNAMGEIADAQRKEPSLALLRCARLAALRAPIHQLFLIA